MYILGIHDAHCATAALLKDGRLITCASEERFTRFKNQAGFPFRAVKYCFKAAKITGKDIDLLVFAGTSLPPFLATASAGTGKEVLSLGFLKFLKIGKTLYFCFRSLLLFLEYKIPHFPSLEVWMTKMVFGFFQRSLEKKIETLIWKKTGVHPKKFVRIDHHLAHACAALYSSPFALKNKKALVFTCDGGGDGLSATISRYDGAKLTSLVKNSVCRSLGTFYSHITMFLGMKVLEHEYKVMGLAPYAPVSGKNLAYEIVRPLITLDKETLTFKTRVNSELFGFYLEEKAKRIRFDYLAGAAQQITEETLTAWVDQTIKKYNINAIACGGGVFMNVKANQKIVALPAVKEAFFMPSAGDESNALGAAYWGYRHLSGKIPLPLKDLYLGPIYSLTQIEKALQTGRARKKFQIRFYQNIEKKIAQLLAKGKIVARFAGRMEWGARALGNRSILADASRLELKEVLNKMIKSRDFWMPFAPVILKEYQDEYLVNPKKIAAPYMILAFASTPKAEKDLIAAIHPYDKTLRPQIIEQVTNPAYYRILKEFQLLTGRSGLLNTSLNLHGEPIVCSPKDALSIFSCSGLKYLALENYLVSKT